VETEMRQDRDPRRLNEMIRLATAVHSDYVEQGY
jgi:hypothetical protein